MKLVDYAEEGNMLRTHGDVPPWICELIYAKEQQDSERRKRKRQASLSESSPSINITNVIHARCNRDSVGWSTGLTPETGEETHNWYTPKLNIPTPIHKSLHRYCKWLCTRVTDPVWKNGYREACKIVLEEGLDLERLYFAQDFEAKSFSKRESREGLPSSLLARSKLS